MIVKLLTEHNLEFLSLTAAQARPSPHLSKIQIVGNQEPRLIFENIIENRAFAPMEQMLHFQ